MKCEVTFMRLDTEASIRAVDERLAITTGPASRHKLDVVRRHMIAERDGDLDGLMATLGAAPVYRQWGAPERFFLSGRQAVRDYYADFVTGHRGARLEYVIDRIVVDSDTIITDGVRRSIYAGSELSGPEGWPLANFPVAGPGVLYLVTERQITTWPFGSDGLLAGEEGYRVVSDVHQLDDAEAAEVLGSADGADR